MGHNWSICERLNTYNLHTKRYCINIWIDKYNFQFRLNGHDCSRIVHMIKNNLTFYYSSIIPMYGSYNKEDWSMDLYYKTMLKLGVKSLKP